MLFFLKGLQRLLIVFKIKYGYNLNDIPFYLYVLNKNHYFFHKTLYFINVFHMCGFHFCFGFIGLSVYPALLDFKLHVSGTIFPRPMISFNTQNISILFITPISHMRKIGQRR